MEREKKKKIQEPFEPEDTPKPPQIIDPNSGRKRENPVEEAKGKRKEPAAKTVDEKTKPHLLSDDADISDETTI